jgi:hypothetical protein
VNPFADVPNADLIAVGLVGMMVAYVASVVAFLLWLSKRKP